MNRHFVIAAAVIASACAAAAPQPNRSPELTILSVPPDVRLLFAGQGGELKFERGI